MISQISGVIVDRTDQQLVLDVGGLGYEVEVPLATAAALLQENGSVRLYTHFVVRDDAHTLFGFLEREGRDLFRALIKVNKVGPRLALSILSALDPAGFVRLIKANDVKTLNAIPGVGRVMAERLIMEMRDKVDDWLPTSAEVSGVSSGSDALDDAETALVGLGYRAQDVSRVLAQISDPADNVEDLIRQALKLMG
ncbi:MAG: Holliday junction branch migration protein RuvA [Pseudomonadales bacterium]